MKHIEKSKLSKNKLAALVLSLVLALILAVTIPVAIVLLRDDTAQALKPAPEILDGEARQGVSTLAYPAVNKFSQISFIGIKNPTAEFGFLKNTGESHLTMYYVDQNGKTQLYLPDIYYEDASVNYDEFYMIDSSVQYTPTFLAYLATGLRYAYFNGRIPLSSDPAEREKQISVYGLDEESCTVVNFEYITEMGEKVAHKIKIGAKNVVGQGYYFMVDDREYVYSSNNNYYDNAVADFERFIKPLLVAEGLGSDKGYGPYLTTDYAQLKNQIHKTPGEAVSEDSRVIVYADTLTLNKNGNGSNGYNSTGYESFEINLKDFKGDRIYSRLIAALTGAKVGSQTPEIVFTVSDYSNLISFGENTSLNYSYVISEIEAILTDNGEISAAGTPVGDNNLVKVAYTVKAPNKETSSPRHAVVDLSKLSADDASKIRALSIGKLTESSYVTLDIGYTKENAVITNEKYKVIEIISVTDKNGKPQEKITSSSVVTYRYSVESEGKKPYQGISSFSLAKTEKTSVEQRLASVLMDRGVSRNIALEFNSVDFYFEYFQDFTTYKVKEIKYFVTSETVVAFRFQNSSERDPYYGESFYENIMDDEHKLYGLNASACEQVAKILGGLSEESTTATAAGLAGDEVLAIGLTPEVMEKFGLYAHTIYFELPRVIYTYSSSGLSGTPSTSKLDDYGWYDTIGFTLYVSDVDYSIGKRYVASDMYDIVTTVSAEAFDFLSYDFETLWARRNLVFMETLDIDEITIDFKMDDLKGEYRFDLTHEYGVKYENASGGVEEFDRTTVFVTPSGECTPNNLTKIIAENGYTGMSLEELYKTLYPNDPEMKKVYPESLGTSYFKTFLIMLSMTNYVDIMPEEDRIDAISEDNLVMRMKLKSVASKNASPYYYVYDFYRADDRRVLVSIYQADLNGKAVTGAVSDFYLSTFAFKKLVNNFNGLLNGEKITPDVGYIDEK